MRALPTPRFAEEDCWKIAAQPAPELGWSHARDARTLAEYVRSIGGREWIAAAGARAYGNPRGADSAGTVLGSYSHLGAALADAILQAGLNYEHVVRPRVTRILARWPEAASLTALVRILRRHGATGFLNWRHSEKRRRFWSLTRFCSCNQIETAVDLKSWLMKPGSDERLLAVRGVGPKTVDYLKLLVGLDAVAVDRHVRTFVRTAGVCADDAPYDRIRQSVAFAADFLGVGRNALDMAIWCSLAGPGQRGANVE